MSPRCATIESQSPPELVRNHWGKYSLVKDSSFERGLTCDIANGSKQRIRAGTQTCRLSPNRIKHYRPNLTHTRRANVDASEVRSTAKNVQIYV